MPLPLPNLDDRRWADLVEEGRSLVPRYAPDWSDHNAHDPGITLIELFAWLTEADIYRLNCIPARHRQKFLAFTGYKQQPPRAGHTLLTFSPEEQTASFVVPEGAEFEAEGPAVQTQFRMLRELTVSIVELAAVKIDPGDGTIREYTREWREGLPIEVFGRSPRLSAALYLGFSVVLGDKPVALGFQFQSLRSGVEERARIVCEAAAQGHLQRHQLPDLLCPDELGIGKGLSAATPPHHSAQLVWEVYTGSWTALEPVPSSARPKSGQVWDDTRSLTLDGIVEFHLPTSPPVKPIVVASGEPLIYVRARLRRGSYDAPPVLARLLPNAVSAEQAVPVWQTFPISGNATVTGSLPKLPAKIRLGMRFTEDGDIDQLDFSPAAAADAPEVVVLAYQAPTQSAAGQLTLELIQLGVGNGRPDQTFRLPESPVQLESLCFFTHPGSAWQRWTPCDDFGASSRIDFHYVVDPMTADVTFGNGERGRVVPKGVPILAAYRWTLGSQGNVGADAVLRPVGEPVNTLWFSQLPVKTQDQLTIGMVRNPLPTVGGTDLEGQSEATRRAVAAVHAHQRLLELCAEAGCQSLDDIEKTRVLGLPAPSRAVELLDIERLALDVPGTRVARARAWPGLRPAYPCLQAFGSVTVVILPDMPVASPEPSFDLLEAVSRYLNRRRTLCTRVEVVGPEYLELSVDAKVRAFRHTKATRVRDAILSVLNVFLDPRKGGPEARGWPFGRDVYRSEILQVIDNVPGVDYVTEMRLRADKGEPTCGNVPLCPTWLVTPGEHHIEIV